MVISWKHKEHDIMIFFTYKMLDEANFVRLNTLQLEKKIEA